MRPCRKKLLLWNLTILSVLLWTSSAFSEPRIEVINVRDEIRYRLNRDAFEGLVAALRTTRLERDKWQTTHEELREMTAHRLAQMDALAREAQAESEALYAENEKLKAKKERNWGFGFFGGYGTQGAAVGVGIVWKIF
ncbi:hypothetical protein FACS1894216_01470 [Synergistales bacterium]|nr:hypothetical protein FACS1894216_01470 [Synergistales bacterium]